MIKKLFFFSLIVLISLQIVNSQLDPVYGEIEYVERPNGLQGESGNQACQSSGLGTCISLQWYDKAASRWGTSVWVDSSYSCSKVIRSSTNYRAVCRPQLPVPSTQPSQGPQPPSAKPITIDFSIQPSPINTGQNPTVVWSSTNTNSCSLIYPSGVRFPVSLKPAGNAELAPFSVANTYTFTMECTGNNNAKNAKTASVQVNLNCINNPNPCSVRGSSSCANEVVQVCTDTNRDGCLEWSPGANCNTLDDSYIDFASIRVVNPNSCTSILQQERLYRDYSCVAVSGKCAYNVVRKDEWVNLQTEFKRDETVCDNTGVCNNGQCTFPVSIKNFNINPSQVFVNEISKISWSSVNSNTCTLIFPGGRNRLPVAPNGNNLDIGPFNRQGDYPFTLECSGNGRTVSGRLNLKVVPRPIVIEEPVVISIIGRQCSNDNVCGDANGGYYCSNGRCCPNGQVWDNKAGSCGATGISLEICDCPVEQTRTGNTGELGIFKLRGGGPGQIYKFREVERSFSQCKSGNRVCVFVKDPRYRADSEKIIQVWKTPERY